MSRVVLVTGVCGGIGSATAEIFAREGWTVVGSDIRSEASSASVSRFVSIDIGDPDGVAELVLSIEREEGALDVLVNNAAIQVVKPIAETTVEDWDQVFAVNVRAPFLLTKAASPLLAAAGGAVVNVASVHAEATSAGLASYVASKGALVALTRAAALELAPRIRVNAVLPGATDSSMLRDGLTRSGTDVEAARKLLEQRHPLKRLARPADVAPAIFFLADGRRSAFVTGQTLVVDGGATAALSTEAE